MAAALDCFHIESHPVKNEQERALPADYGVLTDADLDKIEQRIHSKEGWKSTTTIILGVLGIYTTVLIWGLSEYGMYQQERLTAYEQSQSKWLSAYKTSMQGVTDDLKNLRLESVRKIDGLSDRFDRLNNALLVSGGVDAAATPSANHSPSIGVIP